MLTILLPFVIKNWRLVLIAGAVAAGLGWLAYEDHKIFNEGQTAALQKVEQANDQSEKRADAGSKTVDGCYAGGGAWDRAHGVCVRPAR